MPHAGKRHHGEFQALADLHGHHLDLVAGGVKFARAQSVLYRQLALRQGAGAQEEADGGLFARLALVLVQPFEGQ